jgi:hypothetical protein
MSRVSSRAAAEDLRRVVQLRRVSPESGPKFAFESALRQSPRMALSPTLLGLKRAAEARKSQRIAGRVAALAGVKRAGTVAGAVYALDVDDLASRRSADQLM